MKIIIVDGPVVIIVDKYLFLIFMFPTVGLSPDTRPRGSGKAERVPRGQRSRDGETSEAAGRILPSAAGTQETEIIKCEVFVVPNVPLLSITKTLFFTFPFKRT